MKPADLALIGSYPPPWGGVANHIRRLSALLRQRGLSFVIYNAVSDSGDGREVVAVARRRRRWLLRYLFFGRERVVYIFSDRLGVWLVGALMARVRGKRVLIRLRNQVLPELLRRPNRAWLARWVLRQVDVVIAVSQALASAARDAGVPDGRILYQPGFLPPTLVADDLDALTPSQAQFIDAHTPLIAANGKVRLDDGVDVYGLDLLVDALAQTRQHAPGAGLIVCFWEHDARNDRYLDELRRRAARLGVAQAVMLHTAPGPFVPVLAKAQLFVRPTTTDGDANSVREALHLGVPAVASDCVERPAGARLFKNRDLRSLVEAMQAALASARPAGGSADGESAAVERYVTRLVELART